MGKYPTILYLPLFFYPISTKKSSRFHALSSTLANFCGQGSEPRGYFALGIVTPWGGARLRRKSCAGVPLVRTGGLAI